MPKVNLRNSYGYRMPDGSRKYFGPGEGIEIPEGLVRALGLDTEPEEEAQVSTLPADFPGKEHLEAAGYVTPLAVAALTYDELIELDGIGKATANKILQAIGELEWNCQRGF